jgi:hypothetical protein
MPDAPAPATETSIDACDIDWSGLDDDSDALLLELGLDQGVVVAPTTDVGPGPFTIAGGQP